MSAYMSAHISAYMSAHIRKYMATYMGTYAPIYTVYKFAYVLSAPKKNRKKGLATLEIPSYLKVI